ncbi:MAG: AAA family ATPase [Acidimicrobiales bacterium]
MRVEPSPGSPSSPRGACTSCRAASFQRVLFARALVSDPDLVLLDEPTSGIDLATRAEMLRLVGDLAADGLTVVMTTHDLPGWRRTCRGSCASTRPSAPMAPRTTCCGPTCWRPRSGLTWR